MKNVINTVMWIVLFLLLLPSSLAVASWNSLPGTRLFSVKLAMEQGLVFISPSAEIKGNLQIHYTERRFAEAHRLLADQASVQGLSYLNTQVDVTKQAIVATDDPVVRKQLATKYIATLKDVSIQLEQQKQLAQAYPSVPIPTATPISAALPPRPTATPTLAPSAPPPPPDVVGPIDDTQENIDETIKEIEQLSQSESSSSSEGKHKGQEKDNQKKESDSENDKKNQNSERKNE